MNETLDQIQRFANERHNLYLTAGRQHLTPDQSDRLRYLNDHLPILWNQYRLEYASQYVARWAKPVWTDGIASVA